MTCRACASGAPEDCVHLGICATTCCPTVIFHEDPCDCDDCRDAVEAAAELEFASQHEEGLA